MQFQKLSRLKLVAEEVKEERLRKLNLKNQKKGRQTKKRTKILQAVNLHITNAPVEILPARVLRQFYALRWQIELIFKNWKSNFNLDKVTGERPERIRCMIYAKLLFIFISHKVVNIARSFAWLKKRREVSPVQASQHIKVIGRKWLRMIIQEPDEVELVLNDAIEFMVNKCLKSKSNKRVYPLEMLELIAMLAGA